MNVEDDFLKHCLPFNLIPKVKRQWLQEKMVHMTVKEGEYLCKSDEEVAESPSLLFVHSGCLRSIGSTRRKKTENYIGQYSFFGERAILFKFKTYTLTVQATSDSVVLKLPGKYFLDLLEEHSTRFAIGLASNIRHKQLLFQDFTAFTSNLLARIDSKSQLDFNHIQSLYKNLCPALHPFINSHDIIDFGAWKYAAVRLPKNISSVFSLVLSRRIVNVLASDFSDIQHNKIDSDFCLSDLSPGKPIKTLGRRRTAWEVMPGKLFILIREIHSDFLDVITNLCIHAIESSKLRSLLKPFSISVPIIRAGILRLERKGEIERNEIEKQVIESLHTACKIKNNNLMEICDLWKEKTLENLLNMVIHHGDYNVYLDPGQNRYHITPDERWMKTLNMTLKDLVGEYDNCSFNELTIDVISSNTHSVINCLDPYIHSHKEQILDYAREYHSAVFEEYFRNENDRVYACSRLYFKNFPEELKNAQTMLKEHGFVKVEQKEVTGISYQLIDVNRFKSKTKGYDDGIKKITTATTNGTRHVIINIDYAFGCQAEYILRLITLVFGKMIRSINVLGKAGGLVGQRGDILFPTHLLDEGSGGSIRAVDNQGIDPAELMRKSGRNVHIGPVLTVEGTLLQNKSMLMFYEKLWHATGMEMEGSWYLRAIEEGRTLGVLREDISSRFLYYVSDTPLLEGENLSKAMGLSEGIPPLYSLTRIILNLVLDVEDINDAKKSVKRKWRAARNVLRSALFLQKSTSGNVTPIPPSSPTMPTLDPSEPIGSP